MNSQNDPIDASVKPQPHAAAPARHVPWRLLGAVLLFGGLFLVGHLTGWTDALTAERLRALVLDAGGWGVLVFVVAFALGLLLQVPGVVFVAAAVLAWGRAPGAAVALLGALVAISVTFWTVRALPGGRRADTSGAKAPPLLDKPWLRKLLDRLENHPVCTIALLRLVAFLSPPVNYALALSPVRYRDYLAGSALGLVAPFLVVATLSDCILV